MHELSLMQNLFELTETYKSKYRLKRISRIVVRVGELSGVSQEALRFAFHAISKGSIADGAEFVIEPVPARARCLSCGNEFAIQWITQACPECQQPAVPVSGQELHLQTLEGDQEEDLHAS
jgi:hydrogenase nickel incorporation protein HypA/HybF